MAVGSIRVGMVTCELSMNDSYPLPGPSKFERPPTPKDFVLSLASGSDQEYPLML